MKIRNRKGQSLIEYLVLVCLIAVGSLAVVRVVGKNVRVQFANISRALGGQSEKLETERVSASDYSKRDLSDFMTGAGNENGGSSNGGSPRSSRGSSNLPDRTMPGPVGF
jgi:pilus assembly protein Flp/PilA